MKVVLAYSGGLDTSIIIPWLKEHYDAEVIAFCADLGQGEELAPLHEKGIRSGASKVIIEDLRERFVVDYLFPLIQSGAVYEGKYLLGTSIARPLIGERLVAVARAEGATAVAHGATGKGNDQVRFEAAVAALGPDLQVIAPWREWDIRSRSDAMEYARKCGIPVTATKDRPYSQDRNLWHLSHEGGILEDPAAPMPEDLLEMGISVAQAPDRIEEVRIAFERGIPVALNGERLAPVALVERLNEAGGRNGVGTITLVENRLVGMKSRGVYETPGGTILYAAHQELESLCLDRDTLHYKAQVALRFADLVYDGLWFSPLRQALSAFIAKTQEPVEGEVRLGLYKGNILPVGTISPNSLYDPDLATFEADAVYSQQDAHGFIRLFTLPLRVGARKRGRA